MSSQFDKIIITAMDRFVWFILLIVASHLVTEFTRATGITKCNSKDVISLNDSTPSIDSQKVSNVVQTFGRSIAMYELTKARESEKEQSFSFRPLIDGIFELPFSTINTVHELFQRLTTRKVSRLRNFDTAKTPPQKNGLKQDEES